jgi:hypothetical protein
MNKYIFKRIFTTLMVIMFLAQESMAAQKVLVIVENGFLHGGSEYANRITRYMQDITDIEHKKVEMTGWPAPSGGTNVDLCRPLQLLLETRYFESRENGDELEGAVLIGNLPVPMYIDGNQYPPLDVVFMDIANSNTNPPQKYSVLNPSAPEAYNTSGSYYTPYYKTGESYRDQHYEIWVSRINAAFLHGIRQGYQIFDEYEIYANYLDRLHDRMTEPANVPSRGFAMGGIAADYYPKLHDVHGNMINLDLPCFMEFPEGENSSFNWMSQLMAGPGGNSNNGAFNGILFPSRSNRRYCIYTQKNGWTPHNIPSTFTNLENDNAGWEWAALYNHSCPVHTNFQSDEGMVDPRLGTNNNGIGLNGTFAFGTLGEYFGINHRRTDEGYLGGCYFYNSDEMEDPYHYGPWRGKSAQWRFPVTQTGEYSIYLYYETHPENCNAVQINLAGINTIGGVPLYTSPSSNWWDIRYRYSTIKDQTTHTDFIEDKWERLFSNIPLTAGMMAIVSIDVNGIVGTAIADAVRFICASPAVDQKVDDFEPTGYPQIPNDPSVIFSTPGFYTSDCANRGYEDIGSEDNGSSKTPFFLMNCCSINNYTYLHPNPVITDKNIGNLYALGHNGLICMGASNTDFASYNKDSFISTIKQGSDFGQAYLAQANQYFFLEPTRTSQFEYHNTIYALLGAGTLRAQPYVQFGSIILEGFHVGNPRFDNTDQPVLIRNVTASSNWVVTSTHSSSSPVGTHGEIVVRPETVLSPTGEIRLSAY